MLGMGYAMMGTAKARGSKAAVEAARQAISCSLLEEGGVRGARGVLINITASNRLSLHEVNEACSLIRKATEYDDVQVNFGVVMNDSMEDEVKITVIATGFQRENLPQIARPANWKSAVPEIAPEPVAAAPARVEPEPVPEPVAAEAAVTEEPAVEPEPQIPLDDLDVPAYLRKERRYYQ
jgi:cell division protein FtsZ